MHRDDFRDDLPPSRGQLAQIAHEALELLGVDRPTTRAGATEALLRLKATRDRQAAAEDDLSGAALADAFGVREDGPRAGVGGR